MSTAFAPIFDVEPNSNMVVMLGGYDAEMLAIADACREAGVAVIDKCLGWGAAASAYKEEIAAAVSEGKTPVVVELALDIELPANAIVVDHHNENAGKPAAILQVLSLLGQQPSRYQQLIAANDCAYIPGMLALGATPEEVGEVRF